MVKLSALTWWINLIELILCSWSLKCDVSHVCFLYHVNITLDEILMSWRDDLVFDVSMLWLLWIYVWFYDLTDPFLHDSSKYKLMTWKKMNEVDSLSKEESLLDILTHITIFIICIFCTYIEVWIMGIWHCWSTTEIWTEVRWLHSTQILIRT